MQNSKRWRTRVLIVAAVFPVAGCGTVHSTYVPDGRRGYVVTCGGFLNGWSSCLVNAGKACGNRGYETIKGSEDDRSMLIACKVP